MIKIYLKNIHCDEETDEVGADEPYVFVTAVNLASHRQCVRLSRVTSLIRSCEIQSI
jgi:hypothetical protein